MYLSMPAVTLIGLNVSVSKQVSSVTLAPSKGAARGMPDFTRDFMVLTEWFPRAAICYPVRNSRLDQAFQRIAAVNHWGCAVSATLVNGVEFADISNVPAPE